MLEQYDTVNKCLSELQRSNLPMTVKLKLEVQLYHLKRILLSEEVAAAVRSDDNNKKEFAELYEAFKQVCTISGNDVEIKKLFALQTEIKQALYVYSRCENAIGGKVYGRNLQ